MPSRLSDLRERIAAGAIVAIAVGLSLIWVFRVPFFEQPDENAHADYAFTLFTAHGLIVARDGRPATDVHPLVRYLEDRTGFRTMRYNPDGRVPSGYGSHGFYRDLDAQAPRVPTDFLLRNGGRVPWVARQYAYLYYGLDAVAIGAAALASGGSAVAEFFGARCFNVILLALSLALTYLTLCELGLNPWQRLALLAAIGWFPLTAWVSAYVQPDNLAFTAVALVFYLSLRSRREPDVVRAALWLGLALGLLSLTKSQYFIAVALPALADRTLCSAPRLRSARRWLGYVALVAGTPALFGGSAMLLTAGAATNVAETIAANQNPLQVVAAHGAASLARYVGTELIDAFRQTFEWGLPFVSYWGMISWTGYQLQFGNPALTDFIFGVLRLVSPAVALIVVGRLLWSWLRIGRLFIRTRIRRRHASLVWRAAASDVIFNGYVLFVAIMVAVWIATNGALATQGRYWLPFILPTMLCATHYAPRAIFAPRLSRRPKRGRRVFSTVMLVGLVAYSVSGAAAGLAAIGSRFYRSPATLGELEYQARITQLGAYDLYEPNEGPIRFCAGSSLHALGWAIDSRTGRPALGVDLIVDDGSRRIRIPYGAARPDAVARLHDDGVQHSGFEGSLPADLAPGPHRLGLEVYERDRPAGHPSSRRAAVDFVIRHCAGRAANP